MKFTERYNLAVTWQEKAKIIYLYHHIKCARYSAWNMRKTASYFGLSLGYISEAIWIGSNIKQLEHLKNRKEALSVLKGGK